MKRQRIDLPKRQRALIFQGGVALGAYEAGVFRELYDWINPYVKEEENVFDVIAGASIGAINGAILVSHVIDNREKGPKKSWEGAAEKLEYFWRQNSTISAVELLSPWFTLWWQGWHESVENYKQGAEHFLKMHQQYNEHLLSLLSFFPLQSSSPLSSPSSSIQYSNGWYKWLRQMINFVDTPATGESARRYYSSLQFLYPFTFPYSGAPNVFSSIFKPDGRFIFNPRNYLSRIDNENIPFFSLKNSLNRAYYKDGTRFVDFPIATSFDENLPRFLTVTVDVENGKTVAFDSYPKSDGSRNTEYGNNEEDQQTEQESNYRIDYNDGIGWEHLRTSAATTHTLQYPTLEDTYSKEERTFWDGSLLSNTPMRELIHQHKAFWTDYLKKVMNKKIWDGEQGEKIPALDIYIVNLWPTKLKDRKPIPSDNDFISDRFLDLIFHDKTPFEEKVTKMVTDYIKIISQLIPLAEKADSKKVKELLDNPNNNPNLYAASRNSKEAEDRHYRRLLEGQFEIDRIVRIERSDDEDSVSIDMTDYSRGTTENLIRQGREDARRTIRRIEVDREFNPSLLMGQ
jgi:predicted acylesterase/phospholipase RssA